MGMVHRALVGGETAASLTSGFTEATAVQVGEFLTALHQPAPEDAPVNPFRTSLASRSDVFVERLQRCERHIEQAPALEIWRAASPRPSGQDHQSGFTAICTQATWS
jgi:hypothetical protein